MVRAGPMLQSWNTSAASFSNCSSSSEKTSRCTMCTSAVTALVLLATLLLFFVANVASSFSAPRVRNKRVCGLMKRSSVEDGSNDDEKENVVWSRYTAAGVLRSVANLVLDAEKQERLRQLWDDLSPPFLLDATLSRTDNHLHQNDHYHDDDHDDGDCVTHFCFLVHGYDGKANDLSYLQSVMTDASRRCTFSRPHNHTTDTTTDRRRHRIVIHSSVCNEDRTKDGVENGGQRLADEMLSVIRTELSRQKARHNSTAPNDDGSLIVDKEQDERSVVFHATLSVVGNSLGGIYCRYAIAKLAELSSTNHPSLNHPPHSSPPYQKGTFVLLKNDKHETRLHYNVFCTTATPHLGISGHTWLPIPRSAEIGIANIMGATGRDLFRITDIMKTMATSPQFLNPLRAFRKRIAYANAYGTDFPVPTQTAAFLNPLSRYPHYYSSKVVLQDTAFIREETNGNVNDNNNNNKSVKEETTNNLIVATLFTPPDQTMEINQPAIDTSNSSSVLLLESLQMSMALDSLGWTKVFVDVRDEIPVGVSIPQIIQRNYWTRSTKQSFVPSRSNAAKQEVSSLVESSGKDEPPQESVVLESRNVVTAFSSPNDDRIRLPLGHNMIVAFSRSRLSTLVNRGGRPVMDTLANELVNEIVTWNTNEKDT